jgi:hypothetical protein
MKWNKLGQWTLGADGGGNRLIQGMPHTAQVSHRFEKTSGSTGADTASEAIQQIMQNKLPEINKGMKLQPTNEEMFGHLVITEEEIKKQEEAWHNRFASLSHGKKPIDVLNKSAVSNREWKTGTSFNSMLTEEELRERSKSVSEK